jgi:glutamate synthase (NADPH/NADH) small chain
MEYLPLSNRAVAAHPGAPEDPAISARGRHVVIIGGGDTGADCLGTAHRQGAASVTQLEILPRPPAARPGHQPWPTYPMIYRVSSAHEEGGGRTYAVTTLEFLGDEGGRLRALRLADASGFDPVPGTERDLPCDLVLLAMGFTGAERPGLLAGLGVDFDQRGNVARDGSYATSVPGVFVAGDMGRGQSLIVWAIAEGRSAAAAVDRYLGGVSELPELSLTSRVEKDQVKHARGTYPAQGEPKGIVGSKGWVWGQCAHKATTRRVMTSATFAGRASAVRRPAAA